MALSGRALLIVLAAVAFPASLLWMNMHKDRGRAPGTETHPGKSLAAAAGSQKTISRAQPRAWTGPGSIKVACVSDLHGLFRRPGLVNVPDADVLVFAGDAELTTPDDITAFDKWLAVHPHKHKVLSFGNMDSGMFPVHLREQLKSGTAVVDKLVTIAGLRILASPWSQSFEPGAFTLFNAISATAHWEKLLPPDLEIDVLVTHTPPRGYGDKVKGRNVGDAELLRTVQALKRPPLLWVCGHIHEGYGEYRVPHPALPDGILLINAAVAEVTIPGHEKDAQPRVVELPSAKVVGQGDAAPSRRSLLAEKDVWKAPVGNIVL